MHALLARLRTQLDPTLAVVEAAPEIALEWHPPSGQWSALENLAHVARHHEVTIERLGRMLAEEAPPLPRYRAEDDPAWRTWQKARKADVLPSLASLRRRLVDFVTGLDAACYARVGVHPRFGRMSTADVLDFFLIHEAHHLYVVRLRLAEARLALV
jgi:hypothetical protein